MSNVYRMIVRGVVVPRAWLVARRDGYVVMEAIVALVLTMLVGAAMCTSLLAQSRVARAVGERIAFNDAARASLHIMHGELILAAPSADIRAVASDSVSARWIRGSGVACGVAGGDLLIRTTGMRAPDPDKDSLILISAHGERVIAASVLTSDVRACTAASDEAVFRVASSSLATPAASVTTVLYFESGSYYLSQRALRYRLGGEGRQPLTEEYLKDGFSSFAYAPADSGLPARFGLKITMKTGSQLAGSQVALQSLLMPNSGRP